MKSLRFVIVLLLLAALCASSVSVLAEQAPGTRDEFLVNLFANNETIYLKEITLNRGDLGENSWALDLSPDGKTVLWKYKPNEDSTSLALVYEDGSTVSVNLDFLSNVGDPFGKTKSLQKLIGANRFLARGNLNWSANGKYISFYDITVLKTNSYVDVSVINTATGSLYLADTYDKRLNESEGGIVPITSISQNGDYIVYLLQRKIDGQDHYQLCRCTPQGESKEVLYDVPYDEEVPFDIMPYSSLQEASDGSWLLTGISGYGRRKGSELSLSVTRFSPSEDGWTASTHSILVPFGWRYDQASLSASSQYGLCCIGYKEMQGSAAQASIFQENPTELLMGSLKNYFNLVRIQTDEGFHCDFWYMKETENGAELLPADDFLWSFKLYANCITESEMEEAQRRADEIINKVAPAEVQVSDLLPEGYDMDAYMENSNKALTVNSVCLSPDGYYALVNTSSRMGFVVNLYLVDLETMQVRPVEVPEDAANIDIYSAMFTSYLPVIDWNEDGTILIYDSSNNLYARAFRLSAE